MLHFVHCLLALNVSHPNPPFSPFLKDKCSNEEEVHYEPEPNQNFTVMASSRKGLIFNAISEIYLLKYFVKVGVIKE